MPSPRLTFSIKAICFPSWTVQNRAVPSSPLERSVLPSWLMATWLTGRVCPCSVWRIFPVVVFQIRIVLSSDPDAIQVPSGL